MRIPLRAAVLVVRRLETALARPALFCDRMPPSRLQRRRERVLAWLGWGGEVVVADYLRRNELPRHGGIVLQRWTGSSAGPIGSGARVGHARTWPKAGVW